MTFAATGRRCQAEPKDDDGFANLLAEGDAAWLTSDVATPTGTAPRSLHTFITQHAAAFA